MGPSFFTSGDFLDGLAGWITGACEEFAEPAPFHDHFLAAVLAFLAGRDRSRFLGGDGFRKFAIGIT